MTCPIILILNINNQTFVMRKNDKKILACKDQKQQSRCGIKNKLGQFMKDTLSLSGLALSHNSQQNKLNNMFPQINDPTEEFGQGSEYFQSEESGLEKYYPEGVTARNVHESKSNQKHWECNQKIQQLQNTFEEKEKQVKGIKKQGERLQKDMDKLTKQLGMKNQIITKQKKQIQQLKRMISNDYDSKKNNSESRISMEESINSLCPEMLSPQETVQLLNKLLRKVSKSNKMVNLLTSDTKMREILTKIQKH